jgi:hypothetical protein
MVLTLFLCIPISKKCSITSPISTFHFYFKRYWWFSHRWLLFNYFWHFARMSMLPLKYWTSALQIFSLLLFSC